MNFHILTLFPEVIKAYTNESILGRAQKQKHISVKTYQLRDFVRNKWGKVDERPYGGGPGMIIQSDPIVRGVEKIQGKLKNTKVIITSPSGKLLTNAYAKKLLVYKHVIIVCGRYEGIDARAKKILKAEEMSIGPYVLTGGEIPALAIIDATARQIEGVLGTFASVEENRISSGEFYTRPEVIVYKGKKYRVPKVLLSGNHGEIDSWKLKRKKKM